MFSQFSVCPWGSVYVTSDDQQVSLAGGMGMSREGGGKYPKSLSSLDLGPGTPEPTSTDT